MFFELLFTEVAKSQYKMCYSQATVLDLLVHNILVLCVCRPLRVDGWHCITMPGHLQD